ncbi:MAG: acyl-CoA dehydrogenase [SAR324 cluster bacterium]|nr:acyl-CoA dehydrogenase [SAR324 cluster bacterium]
MSSTELTIDMKDIQFTLKEWLKIGELSQFPQYQDFDEQTVDLLVREGFDFAVNVLAPTRAPSDKDGCRVIDNRVQVPEYFHEPYKKAYELGWASLADKPENGGQGAPFVLGTTINEGIAGANVSLCAVFFLNGGAMRLIDSFGSDALKKKWIPRMASGEFTGTMCLSEPQAGSDLGLDTTTAEPMGDGRFKIKGTKCWITNGDTNLGKNVVHTVLARIKGAPAGSAGLSLFLVPYYNLKDDGSIGPGNDVALASIEHKMGMNASPTCVLNFGENNNCFGYLLGDENKGLSCMFQLMNEARMGTAVLGVGIASAAYQNALSYAKERVQGVHISRMKESDAPRVQIIEHPDVKLSLMTMKSKVEAMRALNYGTAKLIDISFVGETPETRAEAHNLVEILTPMCKGWSTEVGLDVVRMGIQLMGGVGYTKDFPMEQLYRDLRVSTIYEGTTGIQALDLVGRKMTMRNGALFMGLMQKFQGMVEQNSQIKGLESSVTKWSQYCESLADAAMTMQSMHGERGLEGAVLYATPFLMYCAAVTAGYFFLDQGITAAKNLEALADKNPENSQVQFYQNKLKTIHFYMHVVMPTFEGYAKAISNKTYDALDVAL